MVGATGGTVRTRAIAPALSTSRSYILFALLFAIIIVNITRAGLHGLAAARGPHEPRTLWVSTSDGSAPSVAVAPLGKVLAHRVAGYEPAALTVG